MPKDVIKAASGRFYVVKHIAHKCGHIKDIQETYRKYTVLGETYK